VRMSCFTVAKSNCVSVIVVPPFHGVYFISRPIPSDSRYAHPMGSWSHALEDQTG